MATKHAYQKQYNIHFDNIIYLLCSIRAPARDGTCYSNRNAVLMESLVNYQETYSDISGGSNDPAPAIADQINPPNRNKVKQTHVNVTGGHGWREGKVTDAITTPTVDKNFQLCQQSPSEADADDVYEPIEEREVAAEHTYQPQIPPLPVRPDVQHGGETTD